MKVLEVIAPGLGATIQDEGRPGWRRFGVPPGGAMDMHAAEWANRLLDNAPDAPVLELLLQGARLRALADTWLAITGAQAGCDRPAWHATRVHPGDAIAFPRADAGAWTYVAVPGGFEERRWFGSASVYPRGRLGASLKAGDVLCAPGGVSFPAGIAGRSIESGERRDYVAMPEIGAWPGPQWEMFAEDDRARLFDSEWTVSARSDRTGYRLEGPPLASSISQIISEPVLVGSVQVPQGGQPIVTMRDGPTVGGYPKVALLDRAGVSRLAQCLPGSKVRFRLSL